jgi:hypothetical protein
VTVEGWKIVDKPPVLFRRYAHQAALPDPTLGGSVADLRKFLNLKHEQDWLLIIGWLVAAFIENVPRPALMIRGAQGAAKSTACQLLASLLDPSCVANLELGRDPAALAQTLDHHAVPIFGNVRSLTGWQSDMLCKAVTGGGFTRRELFTDAEDVLMTFKRAVI